VTLARVAIRCTTAFMKVMNEWLGAKIVDRLAAHNSAMNYSYDSSFENGQLQV
jgi:hypothetical protein